MKKKQKQLLVWHWYQKKVIRWCLKRKYGAILLDPGLGKTVIALMIIKIRIFSGNSKGACIVAPLRPLFLTWPEEIEKWDVFKNLTFTVLHGEWGVEILEVKKDYHIYLINPEGLDWLAGLKELPFDMLIVDESTKFRSSLDRKNVRGKALRKIAKKMKYRYIMTGTPVANSYQWIQGQWAILDLGRRFGTVKSYFLNSFFRTVGRTEWRQYEFRDETMPRFERMVAKDSIRISSKGNIKEPKIVFNPIRIKMTDRSYYDRMHKEMIIEIKNKGSVIALTKSSAWQKCWQIANGCIYQQDAKQIQPGIKRKSHDYYILHEQKLDALQDLVEELNGKPLITAYNFKHDKQQLKKRFKDIVILEGSMKRTRDIQTEWNAGNIAHLAAYPGTSALGLNLQKSGNNVCYYSMITDNEAFIQFIQRLARQGNPHDKVYVHLLLMQNTVDTLNLYPNLQRKENNQQDLLRLIEKNIK